MAHISIISGTDRLNSNALRVARYLKKKYAQLETSAEIIDLQDFPTGRLEGGRYGEEISELDPFITSIYKSDGLVFVCPEYNGGYPGILKLFIDYLPYPDALLEKPVCLVGEADGAFGAIRAVEQLQQVLGYRNAFILPERVYISRVSNNFDTENGIADPVQQELLESQIKSFVRFTSNMKFRHFVEN